MKKQIAYRLIKECQPLKAGTVFRWSPFFGRYISEAGPLGIETSPEAHPDYFEPYDEVEESIKPLNKDLELNDALPIIIDKINEIVEELSKTKK